MRYMHASMFGVGTELGTVNSVQMDPVVACQKKLYMMDVGMCRLILGKLAAWRCIDGEVSVVTP